MMRGRILIVAGSADGKEPILNMHDAGEFFGEIALLDGAGRSASRGEAGFRQLAANS